MRSISNIFENCLGGLRAGLLPLVGLLFAFVSPLASAQVFTGNGGYDFNNNIYDWSNQYNWDNQLVPVAGDDVILGYYPGNSPVGLDVDYSGGALDSLTLTDNGVDFLQNNASYNMLVTGEEVVGNVGPAEYDQSAGTNTTATLSLGSSSGSYGTYNLSGDSATVLTAGNEYIGDSGTGSFTQTGGVNQVEDPVALTQSSSNQLVVGNASGSVGEYQLQGGTLNGSYEIVGNNNSQANGDTADFNESEGASNVSNNVQTANVATELDLGETAGSVGTYELSGDSTVTLVAGLERIGEAGSGTFIQTGGVNTVEDPVALTQSSANQLIVGDQTVSVSSPSQGQYQLQGGTLNGSYEIIGNNNSLANGDSADFNESEGANNVANNVQTTNNATELDLGEAAGSVGTYELSGDSTVTLNAGVEKIGEYGNGTFMQTGGVNTVEDPVALTQTTANQLILGDQVGSVGVYNLSGNFDSTMGPVVMLSAESETVGNFGSGTFTQNGGINSLPGFSGYDGDNYIGGTYLTIAAEPGSTGVYQLENGILTGAVIEGIGGGYSSYSGGGAGDFQQTGGTNNTYYLELSARGGEPGTYELSGSSSVLNAYESVVVGEFGSGTFTQNGGTVNIGTYGNPGGLQVGDYQSGYGLYTLMTGTLNANQEIVAVSGSGTFTQTGGVNNITPSTITAYGGTQLYVGLAHGTGQYNLMGGVLNSINGPGSGEVVGNYNVQANGDIADFNQTGGQNNTSELDVAEYGNGSITTGSVGSYELSGDSTVTLNAGLEIIGVGGSGTFTQNGGVNTVEDPVALTQGSANELIVGDQTGSSGEYKLETGTLSGAHEIIGNGNSLANGDTADFDQTGGTNTAISLQLGRQSGSIGTYELTGGSLNVGTEYIGSSSGGTGTFTQGGYYSINTTSELDLNAGTYNLTSTTGTLSASVEYIGDGGNGTFSQSGGFNLINANGGADTGTLELGLGSGQGYYSLTGIGYLSASGENIGDSGTGSFTQNGSDTLNRANLIMVGNSSTGSGAYNLEAGTVQVEAINVISNGSFVQSGGSNTVYDSLTVTSVTNTITNFGGYTLSGGYLSAPTEYIGQNGTAGEFTQNSNYSLNTTTLLDLNAGTYNLTSTTATLQAATEYIGDGGTGTFSQSDGFNILHISGGSITGTLELGLGASGQGFYNLNDNGFLAANVENIGAGGIGSFTQDGANTENDATSIAVGNGAQGSGTYNLVNGSLDVESIDVNSNGTFIQSGGGNTVHGSLTVTSVTDTTTNVGGYTMSGGGLSADTEYIGQNGTAGEFTQKDNYSINTTTELDLNAGTYNLTSATATLQAAVEYIGYGGTGTFNQSGGFNFISSNGGQDTGTLELGVNSTQGFYNLNGNGYLSALGETIGDYGTGSFTQDSVNSQNNAEFILVGNSIQGSGVYNLELGSVKTSVILVNSDGSFVQSGGSNVVSTTLYVTGLTSNGFGGYTLSGGSLSAPTEDIGQNSTAGEFTQSGNAYNSVTTQLNVDAGTYTLEGTGTLSVAQEVVGYDGYAVFQQTGGYHEISGTLTLGAADSSGEYSQGFYNLSSNGYLSANLEIIGDGASGTFTQSDSSTNDANYLVVGSNGGNGAYYLQGGTLSAINEIVGQPGGGYFDQTAGTNTLTGTLTVSDNAGYALSGGSLTASGENIGDNSTAGTFTQSSTSTNTVNSVLYIAPDSNYNLEGGSLTAGDEIIGLNGNAGTFTQSGNSYSSVTNLNLNAGTYSLMGTGTLSAAQEIVGNAGYADINQTGGFNKISGTLTLGVAESSGEFSQGFYYLSSNGSLSANTENIGGGASGTFTQSDTSTNNVNFLSVGNDQGGSGAYYLQGGTLSATNEDVGVAGGGYFDQTAGTNTLTGTLTVMGIPGYALSGGSLMAAEEDIGQNGNAGIFTQSSTSTNTVNSVLNIEAGSNYNLEGGSLMAAVENIGQNGNAGTFTQSGNSYNTVTSQLNLNAGTYGLSGTGTLSAAQEIVGNGGYATFGQSGGFNKISGTLTLGVAESSGEYSQGFYNLSLNGYLNANVEDIGGGASGTFTQSGANSTNIVNYLQVGSSLGGSGAYYLQGGTLSATNEQTGVSGGATFSQSGGFNNVTDTLTVVGQQSSIYGGYFLSGGSLTAAVEDIGQNGSAGAFTQSGNSFNTVTSLLDLNSGTYNLSGTGTVTAAAENIGDGGIATFNQTGGRQNLSGATLKLGVLEPGVGQGFTAGYYVLNSSAGDGASYINANEEDIGYSASGTFTQSGDSTNSSNTLVVGDESGSDGTYNVSGGALLQSGAVTVAANSGSLGFIKVDGSGTRFEATTLSVAGSANVTGGYGSFSLTNGASAQVSTKVSTGTHGTIDVADNGGGGLTIGSTGTLATVGELLVNSGGSLGGSGTIIGNVVNNGGHVAPGDPTTLTIDGNYSQMSGGVLELDISGAASYDQVVVNGSFTVGAGAILELNFIDGFLPTEGETFADLISYQSISGAFTTVDVEGLAPGFEYTVDPDSDGGTDFDVQAVNNGMPVASATPEPSTYMLLLGGLGLLAFWRTRPRRLP